MDPRGRGKAKPAAAPPQLQPQPATPPEMPTLSLSSLVGLGLPSNGSCLTSHAASSSCIFYTVGSTAVLYNCSAKHQAILFSNKTGKPFACVSGSRCGKFLAAGERGISPSVQVYEVATGRCIASLSKAHRHGIACLSFSPDGRLLASTGGGSDGQVCIWDWQAGSLLGKQHTGATGLSVCFTDDGSCVVTIGKEHFKAWSLSQPAARPVRGGSASAGPAAAGAGGGLLLSPKPASLKEFKSCMFVSIQGAPSSGGGLYALTSSGVLLLMRSTGRTIDKSVNVQVKQAFALAVSTSLVACACSGSVVRLFATRSLAFKCNLPRPAAQLPGHAASPEGAGGTYPDAVACSFDSSGAQLSVMYSDRSLIVWDVSDLSRVAALCCIQSHGGGIWDAALLPTPALGAGPASQRSAMSSQGGQGATPALVSCSEDGSVRFWGFSPGHGSGGGDSTAVLHLAAEAVLPAGDARAARAGKGSLNGGALPGRWASGPGVNTQPSSGTATPEPGAGPLPSAGRCVQVSPDGSHLAVGDQSGNLRVHDVHSLQQLVLMEAHELELLTLSFSPLGFLATGGRDGMIHVFDCRAGYALVRTLDEHNGAAVTAVRFSRCGGRLLSCGADRSLVVRAVVGRHDCGLVTEHREQLSASSGKGGVSGPAGGHLAQCQGAGTAVQAPVSPRGGGTGAAGCKGVLYDLALDATGALAVTVGQDGALRMFDVEQRRAVGVVWQELGKDAGDSAAVAVRVSLDPSGTLALCACADGSIAVYDLRSKQLAARSAGRHVGVATAVLLATDDASVVSVGSDGCIMQWRLPEALTERVRAWVAAHPAAQEHPAQALRGDEAAQALRGEEAGDAMEAEEAGDGVKQEGRRLAWAAVGGPGLGDAPDSSRLMTPAPPTGGADQAAGEGAAGAASSGPGASNTLMRLQQGQPLLSADKLPRWARRLPVPSFDLQDASEGPSGQEQGVASVAAAGSGVSLAQGIASAASPDGVEGGAGGQAARGAATRGPGGPQEVGDGVVWVSHAPGSTKGLQAEGALASKGGQGGQVACCPPPDLDPGVRFEVQGGAEPCVEAGEEDDEVMAETEEQQVPEGGEGTRKTGAEAGQAVGLASSAGAPASVGASNRVHDDDLGAEEREGAARDLFRTHFDTLDQVSGTFAAQEEGEGDQGDSRRLSLTAAYRRKALALLKAEGLAGPQGQAGGPVPAASPGSLIPSPSPQPPMAGKGTVPDAGPPGNTDAHVTTSRGSGVSPMRPPGEGRGTPAWPPSTAGPQAGLSPAPTPGLAVGDSCDVRASQAAGRPALSPRYQQSPHRRAGQLGGELAHMRERLESLHQQFEEQNKRASPWKKQQQARGPASTAETGEVSLSALAPPPPQQVMPPGGRPMALLSPSGVPPAGFAAGGAAGAVGASPAPSGIAAPQPVSSNQLQHNPMYNSTPTAVTSASGGSFPFADGPALVAFNNVMFGSETPVPTPGPRMGATALAASGQGVSVDGAKGPGGGGSEITLALLGGDAETAPTGPGVSPSICSIRKKAKVTLPGFRSRLSPSSNKFTSMAELCTAMAAESAGARAVPSAMTAELGRVGSNAAGGRSAQESGSVPGASGLKTPSRKLRSAEEYQAALQRLESAAAEVAQLWGELQDGTAVDGARSAGGGDAPAGNSPRAAFAGISSAPSGPSEPSVHPAVSHLQAQLQQGVGKSLQALAVVLNPSAGTPMTINGPSCLMSDRITAATSSGFITADNS